MSALLLYCYRYLASSLFKQICVLLIVVSTTKLDSLASSAEGSITKAWNAYSSGSYTEAEQYFRQSITASDATNQSKIRSYIGLIIYGGFADQYSITIEALRELSKLDGDFQPYYYTLLSSDVGVSTLHQKRMFLGELFALIKSKPDSFGSAIARMNDGIGNEFVSQGKYDEAEKAFNAVGALKPWALLGIFPNDVGSGFDTVYEPERKLDRSAVYITQNDVASQWFVPSSTRRDNWVDMTRHFISSYGIFYANTFVFSPKKQRITMRSGVSGGIKVFLNDELVQRIEQQRNTEFDTFFSTIELQEGWNCFLVKMSNSELSQNNFLIRLTDPVGRPLEGLRVSTDVQSYRSKPQGYTQQLPNPYEEFFRQKITNHPDDIENYIFLSQLYISTEQGEAAEVLLHQALQRSPKSIILLNLLRQSLFVNKKSDNAVGIMKQIIDIDTTWHTSLLVKISQVLKEDKLDLAEALYKHFEQRCPDTLMILEVRGSIDNKLGKNTYSEILAKQYERSPDDISLVRQMAQEALNTRQNKDEVITLWEKFQQQIVTFDGLQELASAYYQKGDVTKWESIMQKLRIHTSDNHTVLSSIAGFYNQRKLYDKAIDTYRQALTIQPGNPLYYAIIGDIIRTKGNIDSAVVYYKVALSKNPLAIGLYPVIRTAENRKNIFDEYFREINIDSVIKVAPDSDTYPEDASVVLVEDNIEILYPTGGRESRHLIVARVLNEEGVDYWKELSVPIENEENVEKAVVVKPNGTEIRADINEKKIVFKQLQKNDFVVIKWKDAMAESGVFLKHYANRQYLNGDRPYVYLRHAILVPDAIHLTIQSHNTNLAPTKTKTQDGTIYQWVKRDVPTLGVEAAMPAFDVVGSWIEYSTIPSWEVIGSWYTNYTWNKSKPTYEIREKAKELLNGVRDTNEILRRVYQFVTDSIRYSFVSFRQSGFIPQNARDVLLTKIGDCKDVATLALSLLQCVGIKGDYVLLNTTTSKYSQMLPSRDFDHVIIRVPIAKDTIYMDMTASNYPIGSVPAQDVESLVLPIAPTKSYLTTLDRRNFASNNLTYFTTIDVAANNIISVDRTAQYTGSIGAYFRGALRNKGKKEQDKIVTEMLGTLYPNIKVKNITLLNTDTLSYALQSKVTFTSSQFINNAGGFALIKMPWSSALELDQAFSYEQRATPMIFNPIYDTLYEEIQFRLPEVLQPHEIGKGVLINNQFGYYAVQYQNQGTSMIAKRTFYPKMRKIETKDYIQFKDFYNKIVREDTRQILFKTINSRRVQPKK